ncbi:putative PurR-regulated permease PerM [Chryseobacterium sp. 16F]|uniref:Putative PurR-regulated permease PerM n=1 Tax=Frigoriflavimonas asaccharolytica TaxID=2735899 RepID=A0A8J8GDK3_9FLAO|nr:putative PurR-regulated permease PerM [Frigoriflavimonas asaccharolytica]
MIEKKGWKPWLSSIFIIVISLIIIVLPVYFIVDTVIAKVGNASQYLEKLNVFVDKIHDYIMQQTSIDILSKENIDKLKSNLGSISTAALNTTLNTATVLSSMYFLLYFMFERPRVFEKLAINALPFKKANRAKIGQKFRKLLTANAVGLPVVAVGQGIVAVVGYFIFDAPSPMLLFALTSVTAMLPIVGGSIVFVPVCIFMIAEGNTFGGVGLLIYCIVAVGLTDNILRFTLLKKLENIHPLNTVFGIIMGINIFGFMGLIFGPILVSMTVLLVQIYKDEFNDEEQPPELQLPSEQEIEQKIILEL